MLALINNRSGTADGRKTAVNRKNITLLGLFALMTAAAVALSLCMGRYRVHPADLVRLVAGLPAADRMAANVIFGIRLPRVLMALVVGAGLAVAGVSLQAMFGNPLVSSHILGVSASAGFGAALGILLSGPFWVIQGGAVLFGFAGMGIAYFMGTRRGRTGILMLVLSGIIVAAVFEALTSLVKYLADPEEKLPAITYWLMGSLSSVSVKDLFTGAPAILAGVALLWVLRWQLNVISLREDEAVSLGLNLKRLRLVIIVATTVITAVTVSVCGIISFVGLAVPHFARMLVGNDNRLVVPASVFLGGAFVVLMDTAARTISSAEIPLSILTAIIGAPFFGILLRKTGGGWHD
ncbi:MAG: iron ABC transporter permease [Spirochaetaceae bacterium]|jgi:iron complex transport system permease protein|nr:iron ABC transporter permease [Spirochaetaceae bacterium]